MCSEQGLGKWRSLFRPCDTINEGQSPLNGALALISLVQIPEGNLDKGAVHCNWAGNWGLGLKGNWA